jgi:protein gp37
MKVSDGCKHCYAEKQVTTVMHREGVWGPAKTTHRARTSDANWQKPRRWNRDCREKGIADRVFCASLADVFEDHPDWEAPRRDLWQLIRETPFLWWQLLTKRPENILRFLPDDWGIGGIGGPYANVWLGTSVEDLRVAHRVEILRAVNAAVRFISYEPALGPLDGLNLEGIDWVIYGGESGPHYRADDPYWVVNMRDRCAALDIAFFDKQKCGPRTEMGSALNRIGEETVRQYPIPRGVYPRSMARLPRDIREAYHNRISMDRGEDSKALPVLDSDYPESRSLFDQEGA